MSSSEMLRGGFFLDKMIVPYLKKIFNTKKPLLKHRFPFEIFY